MKAAIYARYSTDNQNSDTIDVQANKCAQYAESHGFRIVDIYADEATSGMKSHRPELDRFFDDAKLSRFECVLIYDQSRFSRDIVDWFNFRRALQTSKIQLISVTQAFVGGDINDPSVFASEGINALMNQMHVLQTRQKTLEKMKYLAQQALHTGGVPPLGFDVKDKHYFINEAEADIVRAVFSMYANGRSYNEIIDYTARVGAKTKRGSSFGKNSIHDLLTNERYIGTYLYGKVPRVSGVRRNTHASPSPDCIRIEDAIPRIISNELWEKVRKRMGDNKRNAANTAKMKYLLSGKVFCGHCGASMVGVNNRGRYFYYGCSAHQRLRTCDKKLVPKEPLESLVISRVREIIRPDNVREHARYIYNSVESARKTAHPEQVAFAKEFSSVNQKIRAINEAIANGVYSSSTTVMLKGLEERAAEIEVILYDIKKSQINATKFTEPEIAKILLTALQQSDVDIVKMFVDRVVCYDDGKVDIIFNPLGIDYSKYSDIREEKAIDYTTTDATGLAAPDKGIAFAVSFSRVWVWSPLFFGKYRQTCSRII